MKLLNKIGLLALVATSLFSCEDDEKMGPIIPGPPTGVEVTYEVSVSADIITQISYRMGDGDLLFGNPNPDNALLWSKILVAMFSKMPETVFLQAKCLNNTATPQTCTLKIYEGSELIKTQTGVVPPADTNPTTDDTVTITTSTTITE